MLYIYFFYVNKLLSEINKYNSDSSVHGIIVQMPLDCIENIDSHLITNAVSPEKDVDGLIYLIIYTCCN